MWKAIVTLLLIPLTLMSQQQASSTSKAMKATENNVIMLERREGEILLKLVDLEQALEKKLDSLIKHLTSARDSSETGTLVIRKKKKIIRDLQDAHQAYKQKRENIDKQFKNVKVIQRDIDSLKEWLDEKINTSIKQITTVTDSLAHYREYYDRNHYNDRKNVQTADREKNRVIKGFEKEIEALNKHVKILDGSYESPSYKENMYNAMQVASERVNLIEHSIEDILNGGDDGKKIGKVAALRLDREIRKSTAEINGYLKSFLYAIDIYERTLQKRKLAETQLEKLIKTSKK
jgi:hypothetical protein